jgi:ParB family chromosome partitioning protein
MALGRGLGALIAPTISGKQKKEVVFLNKKNEPGIANKIWSIPISEINPNAKQPRQYFDTEELKELSDSIKKHGLLQPILVSEKKDGGYEIIAGERRWRASKLAGLVSIDALVKQMPEAEKLEVALIENIQRTDLNPIEEAFAYERLINEFGLTQQEVSEKVGKSRPAIANTIRLLDLPEPAKKALIEKKINSGQARALLSLKSEKDQLDALSSMLGQKISVRELEKKIQKTKSFESLRKDANLIYIENKLRDELNTKVSITKKGESGKIMIDYYTKEDLGRIVKKIIED